MNLSEFIINVEAFNANINIPLIRKAYEFGEKAHKNQKRFSGEPYISHCLEVALILAEQHMDSTTIAAGILHDVVEDTEVSLEDIEKEFGSEISFLLNGLTKIKNIRYSDYIEKQASYYRKMILAMAEDIRVVIIKLADRLHNMRTLGFMPEEKQLLIASETREVYAPLAHRLGMAKVKYELEDLALRYLHPKDYKEIDEKIKLSQREREAYIRRVINPLYRELYKAGIKAEIFGRAKHYDSIYRKLKKGNRKFEEIYDLLAIRVVTETQEECYHTLGIVHTIWPPVEGRFHDYIARPKSNMYRSIHTTVAGPENRWVEIQIRTHEMHRTAEYGIAAHWLYKEGKDALDEQDKRIVWVRRIMEWQSEMLNPEEFMEYLKIDLFFDDVFVYTPKGELKQLPKGATALDFAFAIHTDIGLHCHIAKINGAIRQLSTELKNGDEVGIITSPRAHPNHDWLSIVRTSKAKSKIRSWLKQQGFQEAMELGKDILERELKKQRIGFPDNDKLLDIAMALDQRDVPSLYAAIGDGRISYQTVINRIIPPSARKPKKRIISHFIERARKVSKGIKVQGMDSMVFRFAKCCQPIPGDMIIGYITRGRGVSVHRKDCHNIEKLLNDSERRIEVEWDVDDNTAFMVKLDLSVEDRKDIVRDISEAVASVDINVRGIEINKLAPLYNASMVIAIKNLKQLNYAIRKLKAVKGVYAVERTTSLKFDEFNSNS